MCKKGGVFSGLLLTGNGGGSRQIGQVHATNRPGVRIEQIVQLTGRFVLPVDTLQPDAELGVIAPAATHEHVVRSQLQLTLAAIIEHVEQ